MRHPHKYGRALKITFSFTYLLDATAAVVGLLMFGDEVMDASKSTEEDLFLLWTALMVITSMARGFSRTIPDDAIEVYSLRIRTRKAC